MNIGDLRGLALSKENFTTLTDYIDFARRFLEFRADGNLQAEIVARNEHVYRFFQYGADAGYQVSRPINSELYYTADEFDGSVRLFRDVLETLSRGERPEDSARPTVGRVVYTLQQSIGAALDALPAGMSNNARKVNGDLFERLIGIIVNALGTECKSGVLRVPIKGPDGTELLKMSYQHDLMIEVEGELKAIGSVKTSSKDRVDKIFIDKFLYSRLTETDLPHIAIFLNDVQRKGVAPNLGVNGTFLRGHFLGYTIKLNALDGVYYCDLRPNMVSDPLLAEQIHTLDVLFYDDLPRIVAKHGVDVGDVELSVVPTTSL